MGGSQAREEQAERLMNAFVIAHEFDRVAQSARATAFDLAAEGPGWYANIPSQLEDPFIMSLWGSSLGLGDGIKSRFHDQALPYKLPVHTDPNIMNVLRPAIAHQVEIAGQSLQGLHDIRKAISHEFTGLSVLVTGAANNGAITHTVDIPWHETPPSWEPEAVEQATGVIVGTSLVANHPTLHPHQLMVSDRHAVTVDRFTVAVLDGLGEPQVAIELL